MPRDAQRYRQVVYRFLFSARWLGALLAAIVVAVACVGLALWQLDRLHQKQTLNAAFIATARADPVPVAQALAGPPQEYHLIAATGRYDEAHQVLLRGQLQDGRPGFHVLTPLVTQDRTALVVDRGWIPIQTTGTSTASPVIPPTPSGTVQVVGRIRLSEQQRSVRPATVSGVLQVAVVNVDELAAAMPYPIYPAYAELTEQSPPVDTSPELIALPQLDEGPHLAYAFQWFLFAALAFVAYGFYARQEAARQEAARQEAARQEAQQPGTAAAVRTGAGSTAGRTVSSIIES